MDSQFLGSAVEMLILEVAERGADVWVCAGADGRRAIARLSSS